MYLKQIFLYQFLPAALAQSWHGEFTSFLICSAWIDIGDKVSKLGWKIVINALGNKTIHMCENRECQKKKDD